MQEVELLLLFLQCLKKNTREVDHNPDIHMTMLSHSKGSLNKTKDIHHQELNINVKVEVNLAANQDKFLKSTNKLSQLSRPRLTTTEECIKNNKESWTRSISKIRCMTMAKETQTCNHRYSTRKTKTS